MEKRGRPPGRRVFPKMIHLSRSSSEKLDKIASKMRTSRSVIVNKMIELFDLENVSQEELDNFR